MVAVLAFVGGHIQDLQSIKLSGDRDSPFDSTISVVSVVSFLNILNVMNIVHITSARFFPYTAAPKCPKDVVTSRAN